MMHVNAWLVDAFLQAQLAQSVGASEHLGSQQLPPLVVQQSLVSWISAHELLLCAMYLSIVGTYRISISPLLSIMSNVRSTNVITGLVFFLIMCVVNVY
jgi:hypothetical protein